MSCCKVWIYWVYKIYNRLSCRNNFIFTSHHMYIIEYLICYLIFFLLPVNLFCSFAYLLLIIVLHRLFDCFEHISLNNSKGSETSLKDGNLLVPVHFLINEFKKYKDHFVYIQSKVFLMCVSSNYKINIPTNKK